MSADGPDIRPALFISRIRPDIKINIRLISKDGYQILAGYLFRYSVSGRIFEQSFGILPDYKFDYWLLPDTVYHPSQLDIMAIPILIYAIPYVGNS